MTVTLNLAPEHRALLDASAISPEVAEGRGYWTAYSAEDMEAVGFAPNQARAPALMIPSYRPNGALGTYQARPDDPRVIGLYTMKYETPRGGTATLDVHPSQVAAVRDVRQPLLITEGLRKVDAGVSKGLVMLGLMGVDAWRGKDENGGKRALVDWEDIPLNGRAVSIVFDSDVSENPKVQRSLVRFRKFLASRGATVSIIYLPRLAGEKTGLDDFFAAGKTITELLSYEEGNLRVLEAESPVFNTTDEGNAQRMAHYEGAEIRWLAEWKRWLIWDDIRWKVDDTLEIERRASRIFGRILGESLEAVESNDPDRAKHLAKWAFSSQSRARKVAMIEGLRGQPGISISPDMLDRDPWLLNVNNGTLDLRTGSLRPHDPADLLTKLAPVSYNPSAKAPTFDQFMASILEPEVVTFLQRALGYCLTGSTEEQSFFVLYGYGQNGKSTLLALIDDLLGDYATKTRTELLTARKGDGIPNELAGLRGIRYTYASETSEGQRLDVSKIKEMAAGEPVKARFLHGEFFTFHPQFKIWLSTNHKPVISDTSRGAWRRINLIPFTVEIPDEKVDRKMPEKLRQEASGVLNWLVQGCLDWQREGMALPKAVVKATRDYQAEMDILSQWIEDNCILRPDAAEYANTLYNDYKQWAMEAGVSQLAQRTWGMRLKEKFHSLQNRRSTAGKTRWYGIKLFDPIMDIRTADGSPENQSPAIGHPPDSPVVADGNGGPEGLSDPSSLVSHSREKYIEEKVGNDLTSRIHHSPEADWVGPPIEYVTDPEVARHWAARWTASRPDWLGFDIETTGLNPRVEEMRLMQFYYPDQDQILVFDTRSIDPRVFAEVLRTVPLVGHNIGFELGFLRTHDLPWPPKVWDTMIATTVLDAGKMRPKGHYTLESVAARFANIHLDKAEQMSDWSVVELSEAQITYAARDAWASYAAMAAQREMLDYEGLTRVADLEMRVVPAITWLATNGAPLSVERWTALAEINEARRAAALTELAAIQPDINWNSHVQIKEVLSRFGIDLPSTKEEYLTPYKDVLDEETGRPKYPIIRALLHYREAQKRSSTYGRNWLERVVDGRIYADWKQNFTETGRMSCADPNLQNLPRPVVDKSTGELVPGTDFRSAFVAPEGRVLITADYSQIELRLAAAFSGDQRMLAAYRAGEDLHTLTAKLITKKAQPTKEDRYLAKVLNFGLLYGMGAEKLRDFARNEYGIDLDIDEAVRFRNEFFRAYPGLRQWHRDQGADSVGTTETAYGRKRFNLRVFAEKLNSPVQGSGADGLKLALARLYEERADHPGIFPVLVVHDEIVLEGPVDQSGEAQAWLERVMTEEMRKVLAEVPVEVEAVVAPEWSK